MKINMSKDFKSIVENILFECFSGLLGSEQYINDKMHLKWNNADIEIPLFNFIFRFNCVPGHEQEGIDIIKHSFEQTKRSSTWILGPSSHSKDLSPLLHTNGIQFYKPAKGMLIELRDPLNPMLEDPDIKIIRVSTPKELHIWAEIVGTAFHFEPPIGCLPVIEHLSNNYQFNRPYIFFLAYYRDEPAGAAMLYLGSDKAAGHFRDSVLPNHRNQGIGSALVRARLEYAKSQGFAYAVAHCLPSSAGLYERQGFNPYGDYNLYTHDYTSF